MDRPHFLRRLMVTVLGGAITWLAGCTRPGTTSPSGPDAGRQPADAIFQDVTPGSGVEFAHRNGEVAGHYAILDTLGGGVGLIDYDGDGRLDIFVPGGGFFEGKAIRGHPSALYRNLGGWKFEDVTRVVGLDQPLFYTHGCAVADYDRDGWPDLLVTGWGRLALYHNEPGMPGASATGGPRQLARRFVEVTARAGLTDRSWSTGAAFGDLDGDGWPDLYVCHYCDWDLGTNHPTNCMSDGIHRDVCQPGTFLALAHVLYRNRGDGTFADVSAEAGLRLGPPPRDSGRGLGILFVDVNGDRRPDVYVANDLSDNFLYLNRSRPGNILLEEVGLKSNVARDDRGRANGSMGVAAADIDGTGRLSLWVTNYAQENHALYRNDGRDDRLFFQFGTQTSGIAAIGQLYVGWGTGFLDVDNDGWEDLTFVSGHERFHPPGQVERAQRPVLLHNEGGGRFRDMSARCGPYFRAAHKGRGLALGDLDNDGKTDLVVSHQNEPVVLLRNQADGAGNWLGVELKGKERGDGVGAKLVLEVDGRRLTRFAVGGGSYLSANDRRHVFGLADAEKVSRLTVFWPSGDEQHWDGLAINRYWLVAQGEKDPVEKLAAGR